MGDVVCGHHFHWRSVGIDELVVDRRRNGVRTRRLRVKGAHL